MKRFKNLAALGLLVATTVACGGSEKKVLDPSDRSGKKDKSGTMVSKEAARNFEAALDSFTAHDKAQDWNDGSCSSVAAQFQKASDEQKSAVGKPLAEAIYNSGLAYQRCGKDDKAKGYFNQALEADSNFHRAKGQLVLYRYKESGDIDSAINDLDQVIRDAKFQNVEALVSVAALQMQRGGSTGGAGCKDDLDCARLNLQRALAIDDSFMPAFNQLAVYYLEQAKAKAGAKKAKRGGKRQLVVSGAEGLSVNAQQLDLAALVASQAQRKNPNYAPIHNTTGLILVELKNYNGAVKAFGRASRLDPKFFEAHMNYAAVNLSFRGFSEAEKAYREALKLRPDVYEAHLGLALAIRGQINDSNFDTNVAQAQKHLDAAKKLDPSRPEAYYNEAILTQEFRAKRGENAVPMLQKASQQYQEFVAKAGGDAAFEEAVKRSKDRSQDIEDMVQFIKEGQEAAKNQPPPPPPPANAKKEEGKK